MFGTKFGTKRASSRGILSPAKALKLFDIYMEGTRKINDDDEVVMELCLDADSVLSRIQRSARKVLTSSTFPFSNEDMALRQDIASAFYDLARLFEQLGLSGDAQIRDRAAEEWGYINGSNITRQRALSFDFSISSNTSNISNISGMSDISSSRNSIDSIDSNRNKDIAINTNNNNSSSSSSNRSREVAELARGATIQGTATIPKDIFNYNVPHVVIKYVLPNVDAHLNDVQQLVHCLSLLPTAPVPTKDLDDHEQEWALARSNDHDEQERLHNIASDMITLFINDGVKTRATVAEAVSLAPTLSHDQYRTLLMALVNGISQSIMLETHLLEGLAQLMQRAPLGYLDSDDLVSILNVLSSRLQETHNQSDSHLYNLTATVSHVLDAMVNNQIKGLKREQLHEPLAAYLKGLKASSDPHLVYQAAYASQALLYIPNDETTAQSMLRRTSAVSRGLFGMASAVKGWDMNAFMDELGNIQKGLPSTIGVVGIHLPLYESGVIFKQCLEEGLSFDRKTAWYPTLHGADALLQAGELTKFKALLCEAPCRMDPAFQWGLCQRLGQIGADQRWVMDIRQDAIAFLGEIYKNDWEWGFHVHIKQWDGEHSTCDY
ncbi:hypothetical protein BX616_008262 [Lobosporangium transversale]|nr:hypothetical protein BX616_008262 [Lobosporangium transversale]